MDAQPEAIDPEAGLAAVPRLPREVAGRLILVGVVAGVVAVATYLAKTFLPLPGALSRWFFLGRGPLMVVAFVGLYPLTWER